MMSVSGVRSSCVMSVKKRSLSIRSFFSLSLSTWAAKTSCSNCISCSSRLCLSWRRLSTA